MELKDHPTVRKFFERSETKHVEPSSRLLDPKRLKKIAIDSGADDVGLVEIDRPGLSGHQKDLIEVFPKTKTLMSIVCRLNPENIRCVSRAVSDTEFLFGFNAVNATLRKIATALRGEGLAALSPSAGFPMDMDKWPGKMWAVSHKPVAIEAGLGHLGKHRLLIHPRYGSFVLLGTLLLSREAAEYDIPLDFDPCISCGLCAAVCPVGAIGKDGNFNFSNCMTHNYRDRMGGFIDWTEKVASSRSILGYREKVTDSETASMWQSLSYGICNKSSYCMAVCPAGEEVIAPFLKDRKAYVNQTVKSLQEKREPIFVVAGSDAKDYVTSRYPHKTVKVVSNGLRPRSVRNFLDSLPLVFQKEHSEGLNATYHFAFKGEEEIDATVTIRDKSIEVQSELTGNPDLRVTADSKTWLRFLSKEQSLPVALLRRKIRISGPPRLMKAFARCFPS